ncbi:gamma tubulin complex Spc97/GCP2 subunit Alp4 [Malassezia cuniculi]|uniref:Spindle pole body component n=1 Tax=Malassezia cuniculi TaxID=948313 RepID=A0AAF0ETA1_9BASI|nr:gamma tubulin complex Spc97/GCP2 subunit Alp4 [Malassezia cuniculi]
MSAHDAPAALRASRSIPFTPGRAVARRSAAHMSVKDYDRYLRRLTAVQQSTQKINRTTRHHSEDEAETPRTTNTPSRRPQADAFLQDASFAQHPLNARLPAVTPRRQRPVVPEAGPDTRFVPLASVDKQLQDALIVEDLLYVLVGIEGNYIQFAPDYHPDDLGERLNGAQYVIDAELDTSLRALVERVLPLASYYTSIYALVESDSGLEYGTVMHALCAAIRVQLQKFEELVAQLGYELQTSPDFTLQQLWQRVHPTLRTFALIHALTSDIASITHADVLPNGEDANESANESADDSDFDSDASQLERERRALLGLDDVDSGGIIGGIVKGGEVLSMLWDRLILLGGDPDAQALYLELFRASSQPYARTLLRWITSGQLVDPYDEFMVVEDSRVTRASLESDPTDEYWERRYMLRDERVLAQRELEQQQAELEGTEFPDTDAESARGLLTGGAKIPAFLEPWKHRILSAGKYLNAIRECGIDVSDAQGERVRALFGDQDEHVSDLLLRDSRGERIIMDDASFFSCVDKAYQRANLALLRLLVDDTKVIDRLCSMRHYLFFAQADFLHSFLDQSQHELRKYVDPNRIRETTLLRLQAQLDMVLGSSSSVGFEDPYKEDIRVDLANEKAYDQLQRIADTKGVVEVAKLRERQQEERRQSGAPELVMDLLQFDVQVQFPVSLVISKKNILRWQFVHRCLLQLKLVERSLAEVWAEQTRPEWRQREKRLHGELIEQYKMRVHVLRQRMLLLVQQLLAFYTTEVIEPNWHELERRLHNAETVDQVMKDHFDFLNTCRKECMLTDYRYLECHRRLMKTITLFTSQHSRLLEKHDAMRAALDAWHEEPGSSAPPEELMPQESDVISIIEARWSKHARTFRDVVNLLSTTDNPAALPLAYRLQTTLL